MLLFTYEPADSAWSLVTLGSIPDRALLFAELAARDGGQAAIDFGLLTEAAGRFEEAGNYYTIARGSADDPLTADWLETRILGTAAVDTLILLTAVVSNNGPGAAGNLRVEVPLPIPHPPYQELDLFYCEFSTEESEFTLVHTIDDLPAGSVIHLPLIVRIRQVPHTFRPLSEPLPGLQISLGQLISIVRSIPLPEESAGPGPCLEAAELLTDAASNTGLDLEITGGLLRSGSGELLFHAWNTVRASGMPMDRVLFSVDSLRGFAHAATDLIPLWDLGRADGHEVSIYFIGEALDLTVDMEASYVDMEFIRAVLSVIPTFIPIPPILLAA